MSKRIEDNYAKLKAKSKQTGNSLQMHLQVVAKNNLGIAHFKAIEKRRRNAVPCGR